MTPTEHPRPTALLGHSIQINGLSMYYEGSGVGKPLVLLHGFGGCTKTWEPFVDALAAHYRLIVVDLRGHGRSTNPDHAFTHRQAASDVYALLDALGVDTFSAIGISTGGMTLLHMATAQPQRITAMVLVSATTHFPDAARAIMRRVSLRTMPDYVRSMYSECAARGDEQIAELIAQFNALAENTDDMRFTPSMLSTITARTLVVHGDRDAFFPVEIPVIMHGSIPNAELWIIPGGEHVPIYDPAIPFAERALSFLTAQTPASARASAARP